MKRAKDKYMINRTKYKDIKRYDHKQMEDFLIGGAIMLIWSIFAG